MVWSYFVMVRKSLLCGLGLFLVVLAVAARANEPDIQSLTKAAEQGDPGGQVALGMCYYYGNGVPQDYRKAVEWYQKAAEQGNADGQFKLAAAYNNGQGVPRDYGKAVEWSRKAAEQGDDRAQNLLGSFYYFGDGVQQDYIEAYAWWNLAAITHEDARQWRNRISAQMTPQQLQQGQERSRVLHEQIEKRKAGPTSDN